MTPVFCWGSRHQEMTACLACPSGNAFALRPKHSNGRSGASMSARYGS